MSIYEFIITIVKLDPKVVIMIMFCFSDRAYAFLWDTVLIYEKWVLERVNEQQFFIDSRVILVVQ